jgi:hypothetical protein
MKRYITVLAVAAAFFLSAFYSTYAEAKPLRHRSSAQHHRMGKLRSTLPFASSEGCLFFCQSESYHQPASHSPAHDWQSKRHVGDARPRAWCGWWMRQRHGIADKSFNLASRWARIGQNAGGPAPGVIGVWRHHVVEVVEVLPGGRILAISGNDGRAVRTRVRSAAGAIAWRRV